MIMNCICSGQGALLAVTNPTIQTEANQLIDNTLVIPVSFPAFENDWVQSFPQGQIITIPGCDHLTIPGSPALPVKNILLALPPQATFLSVDIDRNEAMKLPGVYQILTTPEPVPYENAVLSRHSKEIHNDGSTSTMMYPSEPVMIRSSGSFWQYPYVSLTICPFSIPLFLGSCGIPQVWTSPCTINLAFRQILRFLSVFP